MLIKRGSIVKWISPHKKDHPLAWVAVISMLLGLFCIFSYYGLLNRWPLSYLLRLIPLLAHATDAFVICGTLWILAGTIWISCGVLLDASAKKAMSGTGSAGHLTKMAAAIGKINAAYTQPQTGTAKTGATSENDRTQVDQASSSVSPEPGGTTPFDLSRQGAIALDNALLAIRAMEADIKFVNAAIHDAAHNIYVGVAYITLGTIIVLMPLFEKVSFVARLLEVQK